MRCESCLLSCTWHRAAHPGQRRTAFKTLVCNTDSNKNRLTWDKQIMTSQRLTNSWSQLSACVTFLLRSSLWHVICYWLRRNLSRTEHQICLFPLWSGEWVTLYFSTCLHLYITMCGDAEGACCGTQRWLSPDQFELVCFMELWYDASLDWKFSVDKPVIAGWRCHAVFPSVHI